MYALASRWRCLGTAALPVACARCARHLALAKGLDVRPGVALASSGHRGSAGSICVLCAALAAVKSRSAGSSCVAGVAVGCCQIALGR